MDTDREAWRQVRNQLAEQEARNAELQMDVQSQKSALDAASHRLKVVTGELKSQQELKRAAEDQSRKQHRTYKELQAASSEASAAALCLTQQLDFLAQERDQLPAALDKQLQLYKSHLQEQQSCLAAYAAHVQSRATASEC